MDSKILSQLREVKQNFLFNNEMKHKLEAVVRSIKDDLNRLEHNEDNTKFKELLIKKKKVELEIEEWRLQEHIQNFLNPNRELLFKVALEMEKFSVSDAQS